MGHILASTGEMGEYSVEVRRESFYLRGEDPYPHAHDGAPTPRHALIVYSADGPTAGSVRIGTVEILLEDIPKIRACLDAIEQHLHPKSKPPRALYEAIAGGLFGAEGIMHPQVTDSGVTVEDPYGDRWLITARNIGSTVEPPDGYCSRASAGEWDRARPVLDHYVGCLTVAGDPLWAPALDGLILAYHGAPASEATGPLDTAIRRLCDHPDGTSARAVRFLEGIRNACAAHPSGQLEVARSPAAQADVCRQGTAS